jgi:hypothetical protein
VLVLALAATMMPRGVTKMFVISRPNSPYFVDAAGITPRIGSGIMLVLRWVGGGSRPVSRGVRRRGLPQARDADALGWTAHVEWPSG